MVLCVHDSLVAKVSERTLHALCSLLGTFRAGRGQAVSRLDRVWGILQVRMVVPTSGEELVSQTSPVWSEFMSHRSPISCGKCLELNRRTETGIFFVDKHPSSPHYPQHAHVCMCVQTHTPVSIAILLYS